jgi:glycosyltransferase involved in cell wall biosynthesis
MLELRNRLYYRAKPFIPASMRTAIRRRIAQRLRKRVANIWPVMPGSELPPVNWPGWPNGKKFALVLTHDVERPAGLDKCHQLMKLDLEAGFRSSFNFVPEGKYRVPAELRHELANKGFEVGVHDLHHDGHLYKSQREFRRNAERINHHLRDWNAAGFRSGFMLHNLDWLHHLDISYDASTFDIDPFEPQPEGRYTIFPFWVARPGEVHDRQFTNGDSLPSSGYVELPYTLPQDSTLFLLLGETTPDIWLKKLDWIAENGGMALLDTHPDYMDFGSAPARKGLYSHSLYREFLREVERRYAGLYWNALPREVATYVRQINAKEACNVRTVEDQPIRIKGSNGAQQGDGTNGAARYQNLRGKHGAVVLFSYYPSDPRPRRAAEALTREGVTLDFICLRKDNTQPRREDANGIHVERIPIKRERGGKGSYIKQYSLFILRAFLYLTKGSFWRRYDFVHVHNMPDVLVFSALVPKLRGAKIILDLHDPVPELMQTIFGLSEESSTIRVLKRLEKWSTGFADHVLTVNKACKEIYSSRSCPGEKISVVLNSPEEKLFSPRPPSLNGHNPSEEFRILYHGSLLPRNGFDLAVEALAQLRRSIPQACLVVCGESTSFFAKTMDLAAKRGLTEHIKYVGVKDRAGIVEVIASCDVGVIPNRRNIFTEINTPTRIFECLAVGKPVIAPRARGILDYFGDDDLIFFELGNSDDLARKLEFAYRHPLETREIVERGQNVYRAHSWSHEKSNLLDAVSGLL